MIRNPKLLVAAAVAAGVLTSMWLRHSSSSINTNRAIRAELAAPVIDDEAITKAIRASNVEIRDLSVRNIGGIVILRGNGESAAGDQAVAVVKSMGVNRVANLITTTVIDDEALRREAERELAQTGSLAGCTLRVHCEKGVLSVSGTVQHELQKDAARAALRAVRGARAVRVDLVSKL